MAAKNILKTLLTIIITVCMPSCEDAFHQEDFSIGKIENLGQLEAAISGVYAGLIEGYRVFSGASEYKFSADDLSGHPRVDLYIKQYKPGEFIVKIQSPNENVEAWKIFYSAIASCNNILAQYNTENVPLHFRNITGEAYFLRAYCHFRLTRMYGAILYINSNNVSYNVQKLNSNEIYLQIENDLNLACQLLPANNQGARIPYETPHRGTTKALLAEVYLHWAGYPAKQKEKYAMAADMAKQAIDSAGFFGFALMDDFAGLWKNNPYNDEILFVLNGSDLYAGYFSKDISRGLVAGWILTPNLSISNYYFINAPAPFFNEFPNGYRKDITFHNTLYVPADYPSRKTDSGYIHFDTINVNSAIPYKKFYYEPTYRYYIYYGMLKIYLYRYAHTLLTYAEASARGGKLDALSYECINKIRRRANKVDLLAPSVYDLPPGLAPEEFADLVVKERAWELAGEHEGRWFDLVRLEMVEEAIKYKLEDGSSPYFLDPPGLDLILNPNLNE